MPQEGEVDDAADFGDEAAAPETGDQTTQAAAAPTRAMPDYGDVMDGDAQDTKPNIKVKDEPRSDPALAPKRPDAVLISGVQRLNRTHIADVFQSKQLPEFVRLDYIDDDKVIAVFSTDEEAAKVVKSAAEGFRDVADDGAPGPGLWRAMRGMLDFRHATIEDEAPMGFKRQHRGGKQVREFRFWTAATDMGKKILDEEQELNEIRKRPAPDRQEADEDGQPKAKRARITKGAEAGIDLLEKMMASDSRLFVKEEERGELAPLPVLTPEQDKEAEYRAIGSLLDRLATKDDSSDRGKGKRRGGKRDSWQDDRDWQRGGGRDWQDWSHDDRTGGDSRNNDDDWWSQRDGRKGGKKGRGRQDRSRSPVGKKGRKGKGDGRKADDDNGNKDSASALGAAVESTAEELEKRAKRANRFKSGITQHEEV